MPYRCKREGNYGNHRKGHGTRKHPFPKKQLDQLLTIERKLDNLQGTIEVDKFSDIREDVNEAGAKVWKAIGKADTTREA